MKKNKIGFPDYIELRLKLNLENNEVLHEYINYMYDTYDKLYHETCCMSPDEIKFLKDLKHTLMTLYEDELKNCTCITEINDNILNLLKSETDHRAVAQNIFKAYIRKCADYFNRNIKSLFSRDK